jgi:hypothetical protein
MRITATASRISLADGGRFLHAPEPTRPDAVPAGSWRRMSRLSRLALEISWDLVAQRADREQMGLVWGTHLGELDPTTVLLDRMSERGLAAASPMHFQNSVYNAPAGHLSISLGLKGHSETVAAGGATGLVALLRGLDLLSFSACPSVLVVAGDTLGPGLQRSWDLLDAPGPLGESVAAVLLERAKSGVPVQVLSGLAAHLPLPCHARQRALPLEDPLAQIPGSEAPEESHGLTPCLDLAMVARLAQDEGGSVVAQDHGMILTALVGSAACSLPC